MGDVVVYDLCVKFVSVFSKPVGILGTVLLPRFRSILIVNDK